MRRGDGRVRAGAYARRRRCGRRDARPGRCGRPKVHITPTFQILELLETFGNLELLEVLELLEMLKLLYSIRRNPALDHIGGIETYLERFEKNLGHSKKIQGIRRVKETKMVREVLKESSSEISK